MKCQYKGGRGYVCSEEALSFSKEHLCIFHEQRKFKNAKEFHEKIATKIAQEDFNFEGYCFPDEISFKNVEFTKEAYFRSATFAKEADFLGAKFIEKANFLNAKFIEKADFEEATFTKEAYFRSATFTKEADFLNAKFTKEAYFGKAIFTKEADFAFAKFTKPTNFVGVTFAETAHFGIATFTKEADFGNATFKKTVNFDRVTFAETAHFGTAIFTEKANFGGAIFTEEAYFEDATFTEKANFCRAKFKEEANFRNVCFKKEVSFEYTFFPESAQIRLRPECNLGKASFKGSNCERVDFSGSKWNADNKKEIIIFEESEGIKPGIERATYYQATEEIYRRLKQSHQRFGDHDRAGEFYYREMESRRKRHKETKQWINWIWNGILRFTCGYGERPLYTVLLTGAIVSLWALFYLFGGIVHITNGTEIIINYDLATKLTPNLTQLFYDFLWALYTSIITFTSLGYGDLHPTGWSRVAASIEVFVGVFMIALFLFVFTRKMVR